MAAIIKDKLKKYTAYSDIVVEVVISIPFITGYLISNPLFPVLSARAKELSRKHKNKTRGKRNKNFDLFDFIIPAEV